MKQLYVSLLSLTFFACSLDYTKQAAESDTGSNTESTTTSSDVASDQRVSTDDTGTGDNSRDSGTGTDTSSVVSVDDSESASETDSKGGSDSGKDTGDDSAVDSDIDTLPDTGSDVFPEHCQNDCRTLSWIHLNGGVFQMGSEDGDVNERPVHQVSVPPFEILETEVTVAQYDDCVADGACSPRPDDDDCTPNVPGFEHYPANCLAQDMASDFCFWAEGELPTEAQWEFAARSGGKDNVWTWGNEAISCNRAVADGIASDCDNNGTQPVCSLPNGNTEQGLCDMAGNVSEWLLDDYLATYDCKVVIANQCPASREAKAPVDGSAWIRPFSTGSNTVRGGNYMSYETALTTTSRGGLWAQHRYGWLGARCARWSAE